MIVFQKTEKISRMRNPLKDFKEDTVTFEYRTDPLTGRNSTIIGGMLSYVSKFLVSDQDLLNSLVEKTRANCPFCPENIGIQTPRFPQDFLKEGKITVGDTFVVPNLLGHAERSVLAVLSKKHHLGLKEFAPKIIMDGFRGGAAYLKRLKECDPMIRFPAFVFNYLPPAGSSILHPHMQVLVRDRPFYLVKLMLEKSKAYRKKTGSSYWADLVRKERKSPRFLFKMNRVRWLVPFAPLRGMNEVQAIVPGKSHLLELDNDDWSGLAEGISLILRFYGEQNYSSFNIIIMSGQTSEHLDYFDVNLRMISRPGVRAESFTDAWALPYLLWDGEAVEYPEKLAGRIKVFLSKERELEKIQQAKVPNMQ
jgi:UDPglucose--hexose-1-phosphate uridylyltransferase